MKKITALFLIISILLAFTACDNGSTPQGGGGGSDSTVMTVATDLANEIDNMPLYGTVVSVSSSAKSYVSSTASGDSDSYVGATSDYENSHGDGIYYHEDYVTEDSEQRFVNRYKADFSKQNGFVDLLKRMKNNALLTCKVLGVWVERNPDTMIKVPSGLKPSNYNYRYRISYDVNADAVTVEEINDTSRSSDYTRIIVKYAPGGKLMIDGYCATVANGKIEYTKSLHYLEDSYYVVANRNDADITQERAEVISYTNYEKREQVELSLNFSTVSDQNNNVTTVFNGVDYRLSYNTDDGAVVVIGKDTGKTYMSDGRALGSWEGPYGYYEFSLDIFDGWEYVESKEQNTLLTIKTSNGLYDYGIGMPTPETTPTDFIDFTLGMYYFASYEGYPVLFLRTKDRDEAWNEQQIRQAVESVADRFGLTVKESELSRYFKAYETRNSRPEEFEFANGFSGCEMNSAEYGMLKGLIENKDINIDNINEQIAATPIKFDAQNPEYEYFEFLKLELTGKAKVNSTTGDIDLSDISATLAPSVLLNDGEEYNLVFCINSETSAGSIGSYKTVFDGNKMTFSGNLTLKTENYPIGYGEYTLICYIADSSYNRVSRSIKIGAQSDVTLDLTNTRRGVTLNATADSVTVYNYVLEDSAAE